jgi:hypothetical protein
LIAVISVAAGHRVTAAGATAARGAVTEAAGIGSAVTLGRTGTGTGTGTGSGEQLSVAVVRVIATAEPTDEFSGASVGRRLFAVQFRLTNTGRAAYAGAPADSAAVVDSAGQSYSARLAGNAIGCPAFSSPENIPSGSSGVGCVTFEVPATTKITQIQFTLDAGLGPDTGQWAVG